MAIDASASAAHKHGWQEPVLAGHRGGVKYMRYWPGGQQQAVGWNEMR